MTVWVLFVLYCFEAGAFFVIVPWTQFWTYNPLLHALPAIAAVADNLFVRGFVTGFGLAHFVVGIREIGSLIMSRRNAGQSDVPPPGGVAS